WVLTSSKRKICTLLTVREDFLWLRENKKRTKEQSKMSVGRPEQEDRSWIRCRRLEVEVSISGGSSSVSCGFLKKNNALKIKSSPGFPGELFLTVAFYPYWAALAFLVLSPSSR